VVVGRGWKNLEEQALKGMCCCKWRIMGNYGENSEDEKTGEELEVLRDWLSSWTVKARLMTVKCN
jgi:hypothetical protein